MGVAEPPGPGRGSPPARSAGLGFGYPLVLALALGVTIAVRSVDEAALPDTSARPRLDLRAVLGLELAAGNGLPPIRAARARPIDAGGPLTIAGAIAGVALERVVLDLPTEGSDRPVLEAERGELSGDALSLSQVVIRARGAVVLSSGTARVAALAITFPGLVVFAGDGVTPVVERDLTLSLEDLTRRIERR